MLSSIDFLIINGLLQYAKLVMLNLYANIFELLFPPKEAALHFLSASVC